MVLVVAEGMVVVVLTLVASVVVVMTIWVVVTSHLQKPAFDLTTHNCLLDVALLNLSLFAALK